MASYRQTLQKALKKCQQAGISAEAAKILLLELCNMNYTDLYLNYEGEIEETICQKFQEGLKRLLNQEPLQYILGYHKFYGYKILVSPDCLIPRYETEELVANVLADCDYYFKDYPVIDIADIGTGSGAIAIALKKEENRLNMIATDISDKALDMARKNCENNDCEITFMQGDMLKPLIEDRIKLDVLVCNPPYIPDKQKVEESVISYEPHLALFGGEDGLDFYRRVFENAHKVIRDKSFMAFEIGSNERETLEKLVKEHFPDSRYEVLKDLNGKDRMLFIYHNLD
ncbi:MAG TPA: peptide chain release factor N(5)-glutamine methyltransferase [Erysipelotrichaceae bacterium]|jgi:release factor glutamine methyltransferase|nr:peptide chain release factor N(5)-glutamine methyltransferase [Erysipelotrichaceae bacterium]HQB31808.1 peptide chain release factor N(5)-glutamine methyltransferase [Erysipelotrichaceae bacterium]